MNICKTYLNITPEETMVLGDTYNDIELMEHGVYSFAVRNKRCGIAYHNADVIFAGK